MSDANPKLSALLQTPVFPQALHQKRTNTKTAGGSKAPRRDNVFSKSRDTREDRGTREMKTGGNDQTFHAR
jgi:hypothetical protein